ncbi:MAG: segregation/condensation protein A [Bauldia sp.]|nr:segregation/condensation protein A [Bauldia sp.]
MTAPTSPQKELWPDPEWEARAEESFVIDVEGFEGPLDLLLSLARTQKVDLARISVAALAEQYLSYIAQIRGLKLELAAEYLVMAAWLAYLKSRLLLPEPASDDSPSAEDLAEALTQRIRKLEAIRAAAAKLAARDRLGRDVFARGAPEQIAAITHPRYAASLYDLLSAYADQRKRTVQRSMRVGQRTVWSLGEARAILQKLIGRIAEWTPLEVFLSPYLADAETRKTVTASAFGASLELAREGKIELRQAAPFAPIHLRDRVRAV